MASESHGHYELIINPIQYADILRFYKTMPDTVRKIARPRLSKLKREIEFETRQYIPIMLRPHTGLQYGHAREGFTSKMGIATSRSFGAFIRWKYKGLAAHKGRWIEFGTADRWTKSKTDRITHIVIHGPRPGREGSGGPRTYSRAGRGGFRGKMPAFGSTRAAWTGHAFPMRIENTFKYILDDIVNIWGGDLTL